MIFLIEGYARYFRRRAARETEPERWKAIRSYSKEAVIICTPREYVEDVKGLLLSDGDIEEVIKKYEGDKHLNTYSDWGVDMTPGFNTKLPYGLVGLRDPLT